MSWTDDVTRDVLEAYPAEPFVEGIEIVPTDYNARLRGTYIAPSGGVPIEHRGSGRYDSAQLEGLLTRGSRYCMT